MTKKASLKGELIIKRIEHLQCQGIVVHTSKTHVDRDMMINWVNFVFKCEMGATVKQVKVLSKFYFLVIVRSFKK